MAARIAFYPVASTDYTVSIVHWIQALRTYPGLTAFRYPFADYVPSYLYALKIVALINLNDLYLVKTISAIFDTCVAVMSYLLLGLANENKYTKWQRIFAAAVIFAIPTVVMNSSLWAQSDSIYTAKEQAFLNIILFSLYF